MDNRRKIEWVEPTRSTAIEERPAPIHGIAGTSFWKIGELPYRERRGFLLHPAHRCERVHRLDGQVLPC